ncbi:MAG: sodium:solute symporter family protein [Bacteroidota bacterium]
MSIETWTFIIVGLTFALYIYIAIRSRTSSTSEFYVAGGGVSPLANGLATAADWMSAASFISMAGLIAFAGRDGSKFLMGWTGGYVLLALMLAPYLRKFGKFTVPDFIGDRYYSSGARVVAVICAIFVSFTYVAGQMRGVGVVFSRFLDLEINQGVILGMFIVFIYAVLGGMKGITYTQVAQYCVLIFAFMVPAIFISIQMTGNPVPQLGFGSSLSETPDIYLLDRLDGLLLELGFDKYTNGSMSTIDLFMVTAALMFGTAGLPHVIVRFFTVPKVRDARKSAGYALIFIVILYTTAPAVSAFVRTNMINSVHNVEVTKLPNWVNKWQDAKLITISDKNQDGRIQISGQEAQNEIIFDKDIFVLANPEIAQLPNWVIALVAAGGLAAALSTAAGLLLVISTAVSHDLLKKTFMPNISDRQELLYARIAAAAAVVIAGLFGIYPPDYVAAVVALAFGLAASSFFPAIFLGIFDKRTNTQGAVSGMLVGLVFTSVYILMFKFGLGFESKEEAAKHLLWGISPEGIGTVGMLLNFVISIVVSRLTPPPPESVRQMVEDIRIPRGAGDAHVH